MDGSLPGSYVHGIFQARVVEWVAIAFSKICLGWSILESVLFLARTNSSIYMKVNIAKFGEGNGTPLHYSCLENPMDGGA